MGNGLDIQGGKLMSGKLRVTLWITLMMVILSAAALTFILIVNSAAITEHPKGRLVKVVADNVRDSDALSGVLDEEDIDLYEGGVFMSCYNEDGALLLGASPEKLQSLFQNGAVQTEKVGETEYYIYDIYAGGVWFRGVIDAADESGIMSTILILTLTLLPALIIFAAAGGYIIARGAFLPIEKLTAAAEAISDGNDLSKRLALKRGTKEMKKLAKTFDGMFARLEKSFEAQKQFTSDASHEIRTPVSVILAECARAKRKAETKEDFDKSVSVIERNALHISQMTSELLSITRLEQGTAKYTLERANLSEFISAACEDFKLGIDGEAVISTAIEPDIYANFNPSLMSSLIQNLLENARKYGKANGHINISLKRGNSLASLSVADDGIGIPQDELSKVWQRFWQAKQARSAAQGAGLGLSLVRQIARFHGGDASVESQPDIGSTFTVTLPV